ncbi:MAG: DNA polymerase III subunit gamma/tau, partial [bacterium]|nr:DNA polymerase III subunit gamma/tau [bacterium]
MSSNLALYRKYRPKDFEGVLGQDHIVKVLEKSIKDGSLSHAYLFIGSRGTGKTSVARIFAKDIGVSVNDLYEIDAASNRGIDDVRELRDGVSSLPFDSKYKVYILDEVHMFTKEAWNTLLKTLEEPPKHVIFILATTELGKVPDTIVSRCQVFNFKKPTDIILKNSILDIADQEGYELEPGVAELVAILGDGSFRDTLGYLQKVLNFTKGKKVNMENVEAITGIPKNSLVNNLILAIANKDLTFGLENIREASNANMDMQLLLKLVIMKFRLAVIMRYAPKFEEEMKGDMSNEDLNFLKNLVKEKKDNLNSSVLTKLLEAYQNIDNSFIAELPIELALIK